MVSILFVSNSEANPDRVSQALALAERFKAASALRRETEIELGKTLAALAALDQWHVVGCASPGQFGERCALSARDTRMLLDFGKAMVAAPDIEARVRDGRMTVEAAGCVGEVLASPALLRAGDDWIRWAQTETTKVIRCRVQQRKEEARLGVEPALAITVYVGSRARDDFAKVRTVASRRVGRAVTPGEAFEIANTHYLDTFDDDRVTPGDRRLPSTSLVKGRYVPREVRREVFERQKGRCAVPFCGNEMFVEMAHLVSHRSGGSREAENLLLLCSAHHTDFDEGWLTVEGTAASPRFFDRSGNDLAVRFWEAPGAPERPEGPGEETRPPERGAAPEGGPDPP